MLGEGDADAASAGDQGYATARPRKGGDTPFEESRSVAERRASPPNAPGKSDPQEQPDDDRPEPRGKRPEHAGERANRDEPQDRPRGNKARSRRLILAAAGALVLIVVAPAGYLYWDDASHFESTDDAFIAARQFSIAPQVSGYVVAVPVTDNEHVDKGGVIARIDPRNYDVALEQAQAQVAAGEAGVRNSDAQIAVQEAQIASNQAQVTQAQASLVFAQEQAARFQALVRTGAGTVENAQQYVSQQNQQQAALESAKATRRARRASGRRAEGAARDGRGQPEEGRGAARPGRAQPVLHCRQGRPARADREPHRRRRRVRDRRRRAHHVRSRRHLGRRELQGDGARPHAPRPAGRRSRSTPIRSVSSTAASRASSPDRARPSPCCPPRTRRATT